MDPRRRPIGRQRISEETRSCREDGSKWERLRPKSRGPFDSALTMTSARTGFDGATGRDISHVIHNVPWIFYVSSQSIDEY